MGQVHCSRCPSRADCKRPVLLPEPEPLLQGRLPTLLVENAPLIKSQDFLRTSSGDWRDNLQPGQQLMHWEGGKWVTMTVQLVHGGSVDLGAHGMAPVTVDRHSSGVQPVMSDRGMSLEQLRRFVEECRQRCKTEDIIDPNTNKTLDFENATTWSVVQLFVKPLTKDRKVPFVDIMAQRWPELGGPKRTTHFVSHSWSGRFLELAESIEDLQETNVALWICCFALTQDEDKLELLDNSEVFAEALTASTTKAQVLVLDPKLDALKRLWVLFEILRADQHSKPLDIVPADVFAKTRLATGGAVQLLEAKATNPNDQRYILDEIEKQGLDKVNDRVQAALLNALRKQKDYIARTLGSDHLRFAEVCFNLSTMLRHVGQTQEADRCVQEAMPIQHRVLLKAVRDMAAHHNALGNSRQLKCDYEAAIQEHRRCVAMLEPYLEKHEPMMVESVKDMCRTLRALNKFEEAEQVLKPILEAKMAQCRGHKLDAEMGMLWNELGAQLLSLKRPGDVQEAERVLRLAIEAFESVYGREHWQVTYTMQNLSRALKDQRKFYEAERTLLETLRLQAVMGGGGGGPLTVATTHTVLGEVFQDSGELQKALDQFHKANEIVVAQIPNPQNDKRIKSQKNIRKVEELLRCREDPASPAAVRGCCIPGRGR